MNAPKTAVTDRGHPEGVIVHSDRGSQIEGIPRQTHRAQVPRIYGTSRSGRRQRSHGIVLLYYCRRTCWTARSGRPAKSSAWRSWPESKGSITANASNEHWTNWAKRRYWPTAIRSPHLVALVRAGATFEKGVLVETPCQSFIGYDLEPGASSTSPYLSST